MRRIVCLVADGFGIGAAPDAGRYGDEGSDTLGHIAEAVGGLKLPNLAKLGLGCLGNFDGIGAVERPEAVVARLAEKSEGKDTTTGHWEIAGLVTTDPFATFPEGFPEAMVEAFIRESGVPGVLGNYAASGTVIIDELGEEHLRTGKPILYTSADSVFQIAANEEKFGLQRLYEVCEAARRVTEKHRIGRVIARPFVGDSKANFKRTENRRDFSVAPGRNALDVLQENDVSVISVGKIEDIFDHRAISHGNHTGNNRDSLKATLDFLEKNRGERAFVFTNLVDFDMLYGHRRDAKGYAQALVDLDAYLPKLLKELGPEDGLVLTADHGCDPTFRGTDHTREFVPLVAYRPGVAGKRLADRECFGDIAATLLDAYGVPKEKLPGAGNSFWENWRG